MKLMSNLSVGRAIVPNDSGCTAEGGNMRATSDLVLVCLCVMCVSPFIFDRAFHVPTKIILMVLILIAAIRMMRPLRLRWSSPISLVLLLQAAYFIVLFFRDSYLVPDLLTSLNFLLILFLNIYILNFVQREELGRIFCIGLIVISLGAAIGFILALTGIAAPHPLFIRDQLTGDPLYSFITTFSNQIYRFGPQSIIRPSGVFMESGVLGFYIIHLLLLNKLSLDNKKIEMGLLVLGLFATSLAFYISLILYFFLFMFKFTSKRNVMLSVVLVSLLAVLVMWIYSNKEGGQMEVLYNYTISRIMPTDDRLMAGSTDRLKNIDLSWAHFYSAPFWGHGSSFIGERVQSDVDATIMGPVLSYGLIGTAIIFMHVIYLFLLSLDNIYRFSDFKAFKVAVILLLNYVQRPFVIHLFVYLIIIMMIGSIRRDRDVLLNA